MNKNKKIIIIAVLIIVIVLVTIFSIIILNNKEEKQMKETLNTYIALINEKKYEEMYNMLTEFSKKQINQEDFIKRNKNIYEGIDAYNIKIDISQLKKESDKNEITYTQNMGTSAGIIEFNNVATLVKENKEYKLNWSSSMIFPELRNTDKVRVSTISSQRGEILDRNGQKLAENGEISTVGIVPRKIRRKQR
jgi:hypothetical protein